MRASVIQMNSVNDKAANIEQAESLACAAIDADRPDLISFPENMSWCGGSVTDRLAAAEQIEDGPTYALCRRLAKGNGLWVHAGTIPERAPEETRNRNTTVVFDPNGEIAARYSKIHMFDMTTPDGQVYCESEVNEPGESVVAFDLMGFRAGLTICYDIRFSELYAALARDGVTLLFVPAAFTMQTGRDHWHTLLSARAIETQSWLIAAAQWGSFPVPDGTRQMYGRSLVVDPWGTTVAQASDGTGHVTATIDPERTKDVRARMPTLNHRRDWL
ncbi:carbon-nitrogen hydrolase family protein [Aestuariibius sp. 2305UL40-4]|uniref:carbon-nitrogen hydrolase family protein n=1 Tax=Aestuariibius violaceus TaxID=3234132 RepID=UPI00345E83C7